MDKEINQNMVYEIRVNETPILRGSNLDELLMYAKLMYPDNSFVIKSLAPESMQN